MIAETIIKKQDFFDMFKVNVTDKTHILQGSQIAKLEKDKEQEEKEETETA